MKKITNLLFTISLFFLSNCSDLKKGFGFEKDVPDEFLIKKIEPIQKPPNYDLLPPDSKSEVKSLKSKKNKNSAKSIIDRSLDKNNESNPSSDDRTQSSEIEKEILKDLEK